MGVLGDSHKSIFKGEMDTEDCPKWIEEKMEGKNLKMFMQARFCRILLQKGEREWYWGGGNNSMSVC